LTHVKTIADPVVGGREAKLRSSARGLADPAFGIPETRGKAHSMRRPLLKHIITPFPHAVDLDDTVEIACDMMAEHEIRHLPVRDGNALVGVVTDRDLRLQLGVRAAAGQAGSLSVKDVVERDLVSAGLHDPLDGVLSQMAERRVGSALVTHGGSLVGILTTTDVCRAFGEFLARLEGKDDGGNAA
jgi:acetoin utilization protein AcuB